MTIQFLRSNFLKLWGLLMEIRLIEESKSFQCAVIIWLVLLKFNVLKLIKICYISTKSFNTFNFILIYFNWNIYSIWSWPWIWTWWSGVYWWSNQNNWKSIWFSSYNGQNWGVFNFIKRRAMLNSGRYRLSKVSLKIIFFDSRNLYI